MRVFLVFFGIFNIAQAHNYPDPYLGAPPQNVQFSEKYQKKLEEGKTLYSLGFYRGIEHMWVKERIDMPLHLVWEAILNHEFRSNSTPGISKKEIYKGNYAEQIYVSSKIKIRFSDFDAYWNYLARLNVDEESKWITWFLDKEQNLGLKYSRGYWRLEKVVGDETKTDMTYYIEIGPKTMSNIISRIMTKISRDKVRDILKLPEASFVLAVKE